MSLEHVRELGKPWRGMSDLYRRGDEFFVVSTIIVKAATTELAALNLLAGIATALTDRDTPGGDGEEETMVFRADANGEVERFTHVMAEVGGGSRQRILDRLDKEANAR
jgi:hypothetical protein